MAIETLYIRCIIIRLRLLYVGGSDEVCVLFREYDIISLSTSI